MENELGNLNKMLESFLAENIPKYYGKKLENEEIMKHIQSIEDSCQYLADCGNKLEHEVRALIATVQHTILELVTRIDELERRVEDIRHGK